VAAEDIFIQVGANKVSVCLPVYAAPSHSWQTSDATTIFQPNNVTAKVGDTVWFNCLS
jgi:plastocyanin